MTQEEILEYNKRCAVFLDMHISVDPADGYDTGTWYKPSDIEGEVIPSPVLFHSDWNWIMEVLSKIEESYHTVISQGIIGHYVNINRKDVNILTGTLDNPSKFMGVGKTKKEAVVKAINQFLIWYKQNKL